MKKRLLALSLALVMVFVLAACGESTTDPSAEPSTAPSAAVSVGPADVPDVEASANLQFGTGRSHRHLLRFRQHLWNLHIQQHRRQYHRRVHCRFPGQH